MYIFKYLKINFSIIHIHPVNICTYIKNNVKNFKLILLT